MPDVRIAVVIPTRNRSDLAELALNSVVRSAARVPRGSVTIMLSDNSTSPEHEKRCRAVVDETIRRNPAVEVGYFRPHNDLSMSDHWEWIRKRVRGDPSVSHVLYLTDRSCLHTESLQLLLKVAQQQSEVVISYNNNVIDDANHPVKLLQERWSGDLVTVSSSRLSSLASQLLLPRALPRMLNSMAPTTVLDQVEANYGNVFSSVAPDYNFCFRLLSQVESLMYLDRPLFTMHGLARSNGASTTTGVVSEDTKDFLEKRNVVGDTARDAPLSGVTTTYNIIVHEYVAARREVTPPVLPELNLSAHRRTLARETEGFAVGQMKDTNMRELRASGIHFSGFSTMIRSCAHAAHYLRLLGPVNFMRLSRDRLLTPGPREFSDVKSALQWDEANPPPPASSRVRLDFLTRSS